MVNLLIMLTGKFQNFSSQKTDYNISRFNSNTIMHQKTQETPTINLIKCSLLLKDSKINSKVMKIGNIKNCKLENLKNITKNFTQD